MIRNYDFFIRIILNLRYNSIISFSRMHSSKIKSDMRTIYENSLKSVKPQQLIRNAIEIQSDVLNIRGKKYDLHGNCYMVGFGKAVLGMALEIEPALKEHLVAGIISVPKGISEPNEQSSILQVMTGAKNNLPDDMALNAAVQIKHLAERLEEGNILIVLISGGGSALLPLPKPPIQLQEKLLVVQLLASAGASIQELNVVRKKLSLLKGGGLAKIAYPAKVISFILSDIVGDPLDLIASGPTVVNNDAPEAALQIVQNYKLEDKMPASVLQILHEKQQKAKECNQFSHVENVLIGTNVMAVTAASECANSLGYETVILSTEIQGSVSEIGKEYGVLTTNICKLMSAKNQTDQIKEMLKESQNICKDVEVGLMKALTTLTTREGLCLIGGGETTVTVTGKGLGGRNQELAMVFAKIMDENKQRTIALNNFDIVFLSVGTDGIDGPTSAAGAFSDKDQFESARKQCLDPEQFLRNNDSHNFYQKLNNGEDLVVTGHTGTNVMDIHVLIIKPKSS